VARSLLKVEKDNFSFVKRVIVVKIDGKKEVAKKK